MPVLKETLIAVKRAVFRRTVGRFKLRQRFRRLHGRRLNEAAPEIFSEKLFCRMIELNRKCDPIYTTLSDKFLAREFVKTQIGETHLIPLIWHGTDPSIIPFDSLPRRSIAKTNNGSGRNIILTKDTDRSNAIASLRQWMATNFYWHSREAQYYGIKPSVLVEQFIDDGYANGPLDYRFWCFDGKPKLIQVDNNDHSINPFYDIEWKRLDVTYRPDCKAVDVQKPDNLDEMLAIATSLSIDFDFVRVDLYNVQGRVFFGEMTFTPTAGAAKFNPTTWDKRIGQYWKIRNGHGL